MDARGRSDISARGRAMGWPLRASPVSFRRRRRPLPFRGAKKKTKKKRKRKKIQASVFANYKTAETREALFHVEQPLSKEMYYSSLAAKRFHHICSAREPLILTCRFNQVPKETSSLLRGPPPGQTPRGDIC